MKTNTHERPATGEAFQLNSRSEMFLRETNGHALKTQVQAADAFNQRPHFKGSQEEYAMITNFKRFKRKGSSSRYKGVFYVKKEKKYRAQICLKGKKKYVGTFKNDHDAAIARDKKIREWYGEVEELLNFPVSTSKNSLHQTEALNSNVHLNMPYQDHKKIKTLDVRAPELSTTSGYTNVQNSGRFGEPSLGGSSYGIGNQNLPLPFLQQYGNISLNQLNQFQTSPVDVQNVNSLNRSFMHNSSGQYSYVSNISPAPVNNIAGVRNFSIPNMKHVLNRKFSSGNDSGLTNFSFGMGAGNSTPIQRSGSVTSQVPVTLGNSGGQNQPSLGNLVAHPYENIGGQDQPN
eukprot:maker-scaffold_5-snap-gene-14.1-mRNA-1 protein AED:0.02 eAED:0.02 QI:138/1/1/1/1/1/3/813/345